ncbi:hypothetical protein [Candidatus Uabimicrobium amorphum]|uniref:Uncharacterized protein n=1 Tax=Uabimicrobium amorphum TaxID=2596890 RepID=A0A5S9IM67_UABAM|nr:hypothetical protein [Candidatus Uabimicrobium amorphum]BBM83996.1 hypothetical protein UABAM_02351 [Candidatus Uabimicrobium amorphum]
MLKFIIVFMSICVSFAEMNTTTWFPKDLEDDGVIRSFCLGKEKVFLLAIQKQKHKNIPRLYVVDIKDQGNIKAVGNFTFPQKLGKNSLYISGSSLLAHKDGYVYIVPPGSYRTSLLVFNVKDPRNIRFVKEVPLFQNRDFIHYVEMPVHIAVSGNFLFVQTSRGLSIVNIAQADKFTIVQEVDDIVFLGTSANSLYYGTQKDSLVFYCEDFTKSIPELNYIESDPQMRADNCQLAVVGSSDSSALFTVVKYKGDSTTHRLNMLKTDNKNALRMDCKSWEWKKMIDKSSNISFPYVALQHKQVTEIYKLQQEGAPQFVTKLALENTGFLQLRGKTLFTCTDKDGLVIVSGW